MKAIKHSHHEQYLRLSNDDAALLVSSGRWVFVSKFEARKATQRPARSLPFRIFMFVTTLAMIIAALLLSTSARAADKPVPKPVVPYKVCLSQAQAAEVYKGKRLKYREIGPDKCWYAGARLPKHAFIGSRPVERFSGADHTGDRTRHPSLAAGTDSAGTAWSGADGSNPSRSTIIAHPIGVAVSLSRLNQQEAPRVKEQSGSIPEVSAATNTEFTAGLVEDAYLALTGKSESSWSFDAYWAEMMGWPR